MTAAARRWQDQQTMAPPIPLAVRRGVLWSADLDRSQGEELAARVPVEFRQIQREALPQLLAAAGQMDPIPPEALVRRFELGRQCYAAWVDGALAAYGWLTRGREWVGEFERELNIPDGDAYIWDCATLPARRRQRLFSALLGHVTGQLAREGVRRLWIISVITAPAMNRGVMDAGFEPILRLVYLHLHSKRALLTIPVPGGPPQKISEARGLFDGPDEHRLGPLIVGNSRRPRPPETHIDLDS
ncbi:MAG TPA: GNAT family N-acetyltransferase [Aggregatilineales bacterium]|nr:GNAT family N-acetyltransferase [Aggregatilineales bacterium]